MHKTIPDISVIVPVYKAEAYIERCAKSLFEQTYENLEFIFVNDCTPDNSLDVLQKVMSAYPNRVSQVKIINHETNRGVATTRNTGLTHATGKYIGWVDSDDWAEPAMFERLYAVAEKNNSDLVWCDFYLIDANYKVRRSQYCVENKVAVIKSLLTGFVHGAIWSSIVKKELFLTHGICFPDGQNVMEDKMVFVKLLYFSKQVNYLPEPLYYYVKDNATSITSQWGIDSVIQASAKHNLRAIFDFLHTTELKFELENYMQYAKLEFKKVLFNSMEIKSFQQWKEQFAEANSYVLRCPNMTLRQKILGWSVSHGWWFVIKIWIQIKKRIN